MSIRVWHPGIVPPTCDTAGVVTWDYGILEIQRHGDRMYPTWSGPVPSREAADHLVKKVSSEGVAYALADLGALGWELVAVTDHMLGREENVARYFFKREAASPAPLG